MESGTAASTSTQPRSGSTALVPAPIATGSQHVCFICLLNDTETPDASWVNPCPCTLEAHEDCMLRWVAETEQSSSRPKQGLRCPACNARIRVDEPFDSVVFVRERLHRAYSRTSPLILLTLVLSGGIAGSGWYGLTAAHVFAGSDATTKWLGLQALVGRHPDVPLWRWMPFWKLNGKIWVLSLIAPALTLGRALQPLGNLVMLPSSILAAVFLVSKDEMPTWPPSPAWAMTLFPFLQFTYSNVYYEFFGHFEKRLNRALRGRPVEEQPQPLRQDGQAVAVGQGGEEPDQGLWATLWGLGRAVAGLFGEDNEIVLEAEVRVGGDGHELGDDEEAEIEAELLELERAAAAAEANGEIDGLDRARIIEQLVEAVANPEDGPRAIEEVVVEPAQEAEAPPPSPPRGQDQPQDHQPGDQDQDRPEVQPEAEAQDRVQQNQEQNHVQDNQEQNHVRDNQEQNHVRDNQEQNHVRDNQEQNHVQDNQEQNDQQQDGEAQNNAAPPAAEENGPNTTLTDIVNNIVTSLLYPSICFGMGELLRATLPRRLITRPALGRPTGLLQERWGRSLAGGCLFVVLKDAFILYAKYRRVQVKQNRKVRNVEKRR